MREGERQVAPTIKGIRRDHVARYEWVAKFIRGVGQTPPRRIIDFACGIGYGANILAKAGNKVGAFDISSEALDYAVKHYKHNNIIFIEADGNNPPDMGNADISVSFETIEHIKNPRQLLKSLCESSPILIASVPNQDMIPWRFIQDGKEFTTAFHFRHYTKRQFEELLNECGWAVKEWYGQLGPESEVEPDVNGRTLIAVCERSKAVSDIPEHVAIVGMGPSSNQYSLICRTLGSRKKFCDAVWTINAFGDVIKSDMIFHMDDVRIQQIRADARPESNIAAMLEWLKTSDVPVMTSFKHLDYPAMQEFPLEDVLNEFPKAYFNSTAAYAVAYAIWLGVKKITLFGCDFTYPNAHDAEKGRACVEFWIGIACERGIEISVPKTTSLLDAMYTQAARFYGYDCVELGFERSGEGIKVTMKEKTDLPTADEIEDWYDHAAHPNGLVNKEQTC